MSLLSAIAASLVQLKITFSGLLLEFRGGVFTRDFLVAGSSRSAHALVCTLSDCARVHALTGEGLGNLLEPVQVRRALDGELMERAGTTIWLRIPGTSSVSSFFWAGPEMEKKLEPMDACTADMRNAPGTAFHTARVRKVEHGIVVLEHVHLPG